MCLQKIESTKPCKKGYKIMRRCAVGLVGEFQSPSKPRPMGEWLDEKGFRLPYAKGLLEAASREYYTTGWHIFHCKKDAIQYLKSHRFGRQEYIIVVVSVRNPVVTGFQLYSIGGVYEYSHYRVTVAKEIRIDSILKV